MSSRRYSVPSLNIENRKRWNKLSKDEKIALMNAEIFKQLKEYLKPNNKRKQTNNGKI